MGLSLNHKRHPPVCEDASDPRYQSHTLVEFAHRAIEEGSKINSDKYRSYKALAAEGYQYEAKEFNVKENPDHLKWLHTIVSNAKALSAELFMGLMPKHL